MSHRELAEVAELCIGRGGQARGLLGVGHHLFDLVQLARKPCGQTLRQQAEGGVALGAIPASNLRAARGLARVGAVACQRTSAVRVIRAALKPCIAPRLGPNVFLAGEPRLVPKLQPAVARRGCLPARANSFSFKGGRDYDTTAPTPSGDDVDASCGPSTVLRTVWTRPGQVLRTCPPLPHTRRSRAHILTASATTIHDKGDGTGSSRLPDCSVFPVNPATEHCDQLPWGPHDRFRETTHGEPGRIPAVFMVAPTTQKSRFSWKAFWMRFLDKLEDPLPGHKMDPEARARALRDAYPGSARRSSRLTESQYFEIACSAAKERGLVLLVIDEALALARSERGETLFDQIRVLRELADQEVFRIVLVSTVKIRRDLRRSGVLTRRMATVVFPRYRAGSGYTDEENYEYFVRAVVSFMKRLPENARAELTDAQCRMLYENCFGCVGLLCDWYARAIWKCVDSGQTKLAWVHFQSAALTVAERADIAFEAKEAADELVISGDLRLDVDEKHLCAVGQDRAQRDATNRRLARSGNVKRALRESGRAGSRPGVPDPTHRQLA